VGSLLVGCSSPGGGRDGLGPLGPSLGDDSGDETAVGSDTGLEPTTTVALDDGTGSTGDPDPGPTGEPPLPAQSCSYPSTTFGQGMQELDVPTGSTEVLRFTVPDVPDPAVIDTATLAFTSYDADHPGEEGVVWVNGQGPYDLPADAGWDNVTGRSSIDVTGALVQGINTIELGAGSLEPRSFYRIGDVSIEAWARVEACMEPDLPPPADAVPRELFDQQDLVGILATQAIGTVDEDGLDLPFGRQIAHPLQTWPFERGAAIALVFDDPGLRYLEFDRPRPLDQRRRLTRNRVRLALLLRGDPRVDRRHLHAHAPLQRPRAAGLGPGPTSRTHGRACRPGADRTHSRAEPAAGRDGRAVQPRRRRTPPSNAASASVTICPIVIPRRRACTRSACTVCTGSFKVMATVGATAGTGARSVAAC